MTKLHPRENALGLQKMMFSYKDMRRSLVERKVAERLAEQSAGAWALVALVILSVILVRPQIEGWSISFNFQVASADSPLAVVRYMFAYAQAQFPRVLEVFPMALGALIAKGAPVGWGIAYGLILIAKYFAARWSLGKFLPSRQVEVLSILAVVMIPWEGQWRAHNVPMQTATLFMLLAVGTILRFRDGGNLRWAVLTSVFVAMSIASYEALIVISLALPIMAALTPGKSPWRVVLGRTFPPVLVPVIIFVAVTIFMLMTSGSRWSGLMNVHERPLDNVADALKLLYSTSLFQSSMTILALPMYMFLLCENSSRIDRLRLVAMASMLLLLLPLAAAPFLSSYPYLKDGERVGIPVGFGFFMLCVLLSLVSRSELRRASAILLIWCTVFSAAVSAYISWRPYGELQRPVLDQVKDYILKEPNKKFLVRDGTNRLGDVFTFQHQDIFRHALSVLGAGSAVVDLCLIETPTSRFHAEFVKLEFPLSPVPVCQTSPIDASVLEVTWKNRRPVVVKVR